MSRTTKLSRTMKLTATALLGLSLTLTAAACGDEQEAPSADQTTASDARTPPTDSSVPVVGGPKPATSAATTPSATDTDTEDGGSAQECGRAKGPDGALRIKVVEGDLECATAESIAQEYSPKIATGEPQTIDGWECGPSHTAGELSRCSKGGQAFALVP